MSWSMFVWTVLPSGAVLTTFLMSGQRWAMRLASKVLSTPIRAGRMQLSVAVFMTVFCGALSVLSFSGLRRWEAMLEKGSGVSMLEAQAFKDQQTRNVFHQGRNLYLSLFGFTLWAVAWRLKSLQDARQLVPRKAAGGQGRGTPRSPLSRGIWLIAGFLALLIADLPLCRVNYHLQLRAFVTPKKHRLRDSLRKGDFSDGGVPCEDARLGGGACQKFCQEVKQLSEERLGAIMWARDWHILGRWAAELFDGSRGVQQGKDRINALFAKKTCEQVLRSVDKSNEIVNSTCLAVAGISILGSLAAFSQVLDSEEDRPHEE